MLEVYFNYYSIVFIKKKKHKILCLCYHGSNYAQSH